jgi:hypothetical protein
MWRLFATVAILPHGIPSAFESSYLQVTFRIARRLAQVCKLPLKIWLFSASGRDACPPGLSRNRNIFLAKGPFCSLWCGGCSQPSHSTLRFPSAFESSLSCFYTSMVRWLDCGLQATPDSLAHQGLWPSWFAPVLSLLRNFLLAKKSFLFARAWRLFTTVAFFLADLERFREVPSLLLLPEGSVASYGLQATPESLALQCL